MSRPHSIAAPGVTALLLGVAMAACGGKASNTEQQGSDRTGNGEDGLRDNPPLPIHEPGYPVDVTPVDKPGECPEGQFFSEVAGECQTWEACGPGTFPALPAAPGTGTTCLEGWLVHVGNDGGNIATDLAVDSTGTVWAYVIDAEDDSGIASSGTPVLYQLDGEDGHELSTSTFNLDPHSYGASIEIDDDDSRYLAASPNTFEYTPVPVPVRKLDWTGKQLWRVQIGERSAWQHGVERLRSKNGALIIAGTADNQAPTNDTRVYDFWVAKLDAATGDVLWERTWGGPGWDTIFATVVDDAGDIYISGLTGGEVYGPALDEGVARVGFIAKLSGADGTDLWGAHQAASVNGLSFSPTGLWAAGVALSHHELAAGGLQFTSPHEGTFAAAHALSWIEESWITLGAVWDDFGDVDITVTLRDQKAVPRWTTRIGGRGYDGTSAVAAISPTDIVFAGTTLSDLGGIPLRGETDGFVARLRIPD